MPRLDARQDGGRDHRYDEQEAQRKEDPPKRQRHFPGNIPVALRIPEQELRDEGAEARREHAHVQVPVEVKVPDL